jgi:hypothetical protein
MPQMSSLIEPCASEDIFRHYARSPKGHAELSQVYPPILNKRCRIPVITELTANNTEVNSFFVYVVDSDIRSCN